MATAALKVKGGTKTAKYLDNLGRRMGSGSVRVGFLDGATYPAKERDATKLLKGLDKLNGTGPFQPGKKPGRVRAYRKTKAAKAESLVGPAAPAVAIPVATIAARNEFGGGSTPARPFMRNTIATESPNWGAVMAALAVSSGFKGEIVLKQMGELIRDQFVKAIVDWPADNAPLTVAIKGFNKGLIHTGVMQRSVDYEVVK